MLSQCFSQQYYVEQCRTGKAELETADKRFEHVCVCVSVFASLWKVKTERDFVLDLSSLSNLTFLALYVKVESNLQLFTMSVYTYCWIRYIFTELGYFLFPIPIFYSSSDNVLSWLVLPWFCFSLPIIFSL